MCRNKKKYEKIERMYYKKAQILKMVNTYLLSVPEKSKTGPKKYKLAMWILQSKMQGQNATYYLYIWWSKQNWKKAEQAI